MIIVGKSITPNFYGNADTGKPHPSLAAEHTRPEMHSVYCLFAGKRQHLLPPKIHDATIGWLSNSARNAIGLLTKEGKAIMSIRDAQLEVAIASRILAGEAILDAYGHVSRRHPEQPEHFLISRSLAPALVGPDDVLELDLAGTAVSRPEVPVFLERFIHAEIYRRRPDVHAIVHSHALAVLPFSVVPSSPMRPICHMCGFLRGVPTPFDIADHAGPGSDMLIRNSNLGEILAAHLGEAAVILMRGHGFTAVAPTVPAAVYRAVYTARNCEVQQAAMALGEPVYLSDAEAQAAEATGLGQVHRPWDLWRQQHAPTLN